MFTKQIFDVRVSDVPLLRVLTDRGTEHCGQREHHEYQLYLAVENIDHTRAKARHPQTTLPGWCDGSARRTASII